MSQEIIPNSGGRLPEFLRILELPAFNGRRLGITATRALERYSDLLDHKQERARLRQHEIIDITDEFLDVVRVDPWAPGGFEFTGLSLAEFLAALHRSDAAHDQLTMYHELLSSQNIDALRQAARERIQVKRKDSWFRQIDFLLPRNHQNAPRVQFPPELAPLMLASNPDWDWPHRSSLAVEVLHSVAALKPARIPLRGKRFPRFVWGNDWVNWWGCRLMPRESKEGRGFDYNEFQLALPSLETSFFSTHYQARNIFAHVRYTAWETAKGARVMVIDEVQSDWMRNLRWQHLGRELPDVWITGGEKILGRDSPKVPPCPYEQDWLRITAEMIVRHANRMNCNVLAWTPGRIQHVLNPTLPLATAERLYDQRFPRALKWFLLAEGYRGMEFPIDYPCWVPDFYTRWIRGHGWRAFKRGTNEPASVFYKTWDEANAHIETQARPLVERLPGYLLF